MDHPTVAGNGNGNGCGSGSGSGKLKTFPSGIDTRRSRSGQVVSVSWGETHDRESPRLQFEVSECIETKTVTTTTTTKRTFPPVYVREPRALESLDTQKYPLALNPTPPELAHFSFDLPLPQHDTNKPPSPTASRWCFSTRNHVQDGRFEQDTSPDPAPPFVSTQHTGCPPLSTSQESTNGVSHRTQRRSEHPLTGGLGTLRNSVYQNSGVDASVDKIPKMQSGYLATPDTNEITANTIAHSSRLRLRQLDRDYAASESRPGTSLRRFDIGSPVGSDLHSVFSGAVATPPIDIHPEPFADEDEDLQRSVRNLVQSRPTIDVMAAQDASLPSPGLSPTIEVAQLHTVNNADYRDSDEEDLLVCSRNPLPGESSTWLPQDLPSMEEGDSLGLFHPSTSSFTVSEPDNYSAVPNARSMIDSFDAMPDQMQTFMMYQLLRRCTRKTLRVVAEAVNPTLKCDFLSKLPLELSYYVLSYLDHVDLCRASQVSKHWRNIVDGNEPGWKDIFDRDGFSIAPDELERAIVEGWGWQDPEVQDGWERDLRTERRPEQNRGLLWPILKTEAGPKLRSSKRKRANNFGGPDRLKRRASEQHCYKDGRSPTGGAICMQHRTSGPISAANAAAAAMPDPGPDPLKLFPHLRKLHLFKSLYRRHYLIRQNWTSGQVQPSHIAFAAHPRHVITCLQFDEDKIISGSDDTMIHIYDTKTGKMRKRLEGHEGGVWALQYEGNSLVSGSTDRSVRVWDISKALCTQVFYGHTSTVRCLMILMPTVVKQQRTGQAMKLPLKPLIISGSRDHHLRIWRLPEAGARRYIQTGPLPNEFECPYFVRSLAGHSNSVRAIAAHADILVSGSYDHTVRVWRITTGELIHLLQGHTQKVYSVVLDHGRNRCISGSMDSLVKIWDLETGACLHTLGGHSELVGLLGLKDENLVSAAADSTLQIWDPQNGRRRQVLMAHTGAITCFQHDGTKVVSGSDRTVKMWNTQTGTWIRDLLTDLSGVWQVKFNHRRCVAAVQRGGITFIEILDFGAIRDGVPTHLLGQRRVIGEVTIPLT